MKLNFKSGLILTFFALLFITSCQDETVEQTDPNQEETIVPQSPLVNLMRATTSNDGAQDDILDEADCFSIELPVTIIANGITVTIESLDDLDILEDIFDEFDDDEDDIEYLFPITIIQNDYSEIVIEDQEELMSFVEDCIEDDSDDVIECIDFQYPLSFSIYDSEFQVIDTVVVENDEELYDFLEDLEESDSGAVLASLNYPVTLVYANGETVEIQNNQELEEAIDAAEDDCDDDYYDYCEVEDIDMYLTECFWTINDYPEMDDLDELELYFNEDGTLEIMNGDTTEAIGGSWNMSTSNEGFPEIVVSDLTAYEFLEGSWVVVECDDDEFIIEYETLAGEEIQFELEQECEDDLDCSAQEVSMTLQECYWYASTNLFDNVQSDEFHFGENNQLVVQNDPNATLTGTWNVELTDEGVFVTLQIGSAYEAISQTWEVVYCDDDLFELANDNNDYLVFEQECDDDDDDEYDCEDLQADYGDDCTTPAGGEGYINEDCECVTEDDENPLSCLDSEDIEMCDEGNDGYEVFNLYEGLYEDDDCDVDNTVTVTFHELLMDADANVNAIPNAEAYTNTTNPQTIYVRVELNDNPNEYEVLEIELYLEDCSDEGCTEDEIDAYLLECQWNVVNYNESDDLIVYNFDFESNGIVVIYNDNTTIDAMWSTSQNEDGVWVEFSNVAGADIQAITGNWLVVECDDDRLEMERENDFLIMEQTCN
ncbi:hypothetical protein [Pontimicrobium sp. IMCC45349]|uniref:hypothetical protein n=1 Tax=Pontimicrobium sp. IMCC45349 TaxID=3391574 RepID=UPI0039A0177B